MRKSVEDVMIIADNPIKRSEDDTIGRSLEARRFAQNVRKLNTCEGAVVGVLGPWGSGKTSFINLTKQELENEDISIFDFNPWMFSGTAQLIESFFAELSIQLKGGDDEFKKIGDSLKQYGDIFSGLAVLVTGQAWLGGIVKSVSKSISRKKGVMELRKDLEKQLRDLDDPIVVVLDDIDRLSPIEIRDIFKLIRLTANFPNIIYIVAFDRLRIEEALEEFGGRDYLDKIVNMVFDLPAIPRNLLLREITSNLKSVVDDPVDEQVWPDVLMDIIAPLICNLRDTRRYSIAAYSTIQSLNGEIALADVLALEAVRVFMPDIYVRLQDSVEILTGSYGLEDEFGIPRPKDYYAKRVDSLIEAAGDRGHIVRKLILTLFPAAAQHISRFSLDDDWIEYSLKARRIGHTDNLRLYLERVPSDHLQAFYEAGNMWKQMGQREVFEDSVRRLPREQLQSVIASFGLYRDQFTPEYVVPGSIVLLNCLPLPETNQNIYVVSPTAIVIHVVGQLLNCLSDPIAIEKAVFEILPNLTSLSSKFRLIESIGHREEVGQKMVSKEVALILEEALNLEVESASVEDLVKEYELLLILLYAKRGTKASEMSIINSPAITLALLRNAKGDITSSTGSRAVQHKPILYWDLLVELHNSEEILSQRIRHLKKAKLDDSEELIELAERYLAGYRDERMKHA